MVGNPLNTALLTIDSKKSRLRIHKTVIHQIGDPPMIQLMVNPCKKLIAVRAADLHARDKIKIQRQMDDGDDSVEMYSKYLVANLLSVFTELQYGFTYNLCGEVVTSERLVVFPLSTLTTLENGEGE